MRSTRRVEEVRQRLRSRLTDGCLGAGDRFPSARVLAQHYGICLQTADRLLGELVGEGLVVRRRGSGTYVAGDRAAFSGAAVWLPPRAARAGSLGAVLHRELARQFRRGRVSFRTEWSDGPVRSGLVGDWFPVVWECPEVYRGLVEVGRRCLLLYDRPAQGLESLSVDSVSVDDFSGGVMAGQIFLQNRAAGRRFAVVSGPVGDHRSGPRVRGFLSVASARVVEASGWYVEDGIRCGPSVFGLGATAVFCGNDRLAEGLYLYAQSQGLALPVLMGFDGAPVSEFLGLSTIAVPWGEVGEAAVRVVQRRLSDPAGAAVHQVVAPQPVLRSELGW